MSKDTTNVGLNLASGIINYCSKSVSLNSGFCNIYICIDILYDFIQISCLLLLLLLPVIIVLYFLTLVSRVVCDRIHNPGGVVSDFTDRDVK